SARWPTGNRVDTRGGTSSPVQDRGHRSCQEKCGHRAPASRQYARGFPKILQMRVAKLRLSSPLQWPDHQAGQKCELQIVPNWFAYGNSWLRSHMWPLAPKADMCGAMRDVR